MSPRNTPILTTQELLAVIENARKAEFTRDIESLQNFLQPVISLLVDEDFGITEISIKAELLRLYGFYLTFHGRAKNLREYQDRAKDVITHSVELFQSENLDLKIAEANITLAFCYWNRGEVKEAEAIFELIENDFSENKINPVYLQLQINRLMLLCWDCKFDESYKIFNIIKPLMPFCADARLRIMFYFEGAILMHRLEKYNQAIAYFTEATALCKKDGNQYLLALNLNNFSLLYLDLKDYEKAHQYSDESFDILKKIKHTGWMAHILDSKASIYLEQQKYSKALATIDESLYYFGQGEDLKGLISSLWTKTRCLLKIEKLDQALNVFAELHRTARENISLDTAERYSAKFAKEIYAVRGLPLLDEVAHFKKSQIRNALMKSNCRISAAAKLLNLKSHQTLSDILDKQFPELYDELNFSRRNRKSSKQSKNETKTVVVNKSKIRFEKSIQKVVMQNKNYAFDFDFDFDDEKFRTFYVDRFQMFEIFGIDEGTVVATTLLEKASVESVDKFVMVIEDENFFIGRLAYDELLQMFFISILNGEPFPLYGTNVIREIVGFCPVDETNQSFIRFSKI